MATIESRENKKAMQAFLLCIVVLSLIPSLGCKQWPGAAHVQQNQLDNERLLSEFRAQKKRADDLQNRYDQIAKRLDESEKQLASQNLRSNTRTAQTDSSSRRLASGRLEGPVPNPSLAEPRVSDPKSLPPPSSTSSGVRASTASSSQLEQDSSSAGYGKPRWKPTRKTTGLNPPGNGN